MHWPQITWIALVAAEVGIAAAKHGQPKGEYSFWWALVGVGISVFLLTKGGFFS